MPFAGHSLGRLKPRLTSLLLGVLLVAAACTKPPPPGEGTSPIPGPTRTPPSALRIGIDEVRSLDPAELETGADVLVASQIFDGLVETDPATGEVLPAVALRWEVKEKGRLLRFHLGSSAFHDGSPVRAQDFVFAWTRLVDPSQGYPFAFLLEEVAGFSGHRTSFGAEPFQGIKAVGERVLEIRLRSPNPGFPAILAHPALSPVPQNADTPEYELRPIGNGPYRLVRDLGLGTPIDLQAVQGATAGVEHVEFRPFDEPEDGWPEFVAGELDMAQIPEALIPRVAADEEGSEGVQPLGRLLYCGFNLRGDGAPGALRTAVSVGVDRAALVRSVYGQLAVPAQGIVPPSFPQHREEACGDRCEYDPDRARSLVEEVPAKFRRFTLSFPLSTVGEELAEGLRDQLADLGLDVKLEGHEEVEYARLLRRGGHEAFCLVWVANAPTSQSMLEPLVAAGSADNQTGVRDDRLGALLDRARQERDAAERAELYVQAERRALELMPIVPLAWFRSHLAAQPYVSGFEVDPLGRFDVAALAIQP